MIGAKVVDGALDRRAPLAGGSCGSGRGREIVFEISGQTETRAEQCEFLGGGAESERGERPHH